MRTPVGLVLVAVILVITSCAGGEQGNSASDVAAATETAPVEPTAVAATPTPSPSPNPERSRWDPALVDMVEFIEATREEQFILIPEVNYIDPAELAARVQTNLTSANVLPQETLAIVGRLDDVYRALGVSGDEFDYLTALGQSGAASQAYYDPTNGAIVFPSPDGAEPSEIALYDRPLMVHELTHALQAHSRFARSLRAEDPFVGQALLEGEAEWMQDRYLEQLSDELYEEWFDWQLAQPQADSAVPPALVAEFLSPYLLGGRFFRVRYALGGLDAIDEAFEAQRVVARVFLDPWAYTGEPTSAETFDYTPPFQGGSGTPVDIALSAPMSAINWYFVFSAAMPGPQALTAARGVTSYSLPTGWLSIDGSLCFNDRFRAVGVGARACPVDRRLRWLGLPGSRRAGSCDRWPCVVRGPARSDFCKGLSVKLVVYSRPRGVYRVGTVLSLSGACPCTGGGDLWLFGVG